MVGVLETAQEPKVKQELKKELAKVTIKKEDQQFITDMNLSSIRKLLSGVYRQVLINLYTHTQTFLFCFMTGFLCGCSRTYSVD